MRVDWRECPKGDVKGQWAAMYVTMNPKGYIVMSRRTHEKLDEAKAVLLLFDAVNNRIGLKPTVPSMTNAFLLGKSGRHGGRMIRAYRMMQEFGIDLPDTIQFQDAEIDQDGTLVLDLRTARVSARAGLGWRGGGREKG